MKWDGIAYPCPPARQPASPSAFSLVWDGGLEVSGHHCGRSYITGFAVPEGNVSAAAAEEDGREALLFCVFLCAQKQST